MDGNPGRSLHIRQQYPFGLGPELGFSLEIASTAVYLLRMPEGQEHFAYIENPSCLLKAFALSPKALTGNTLESLRPYSYATGNTGRGSPHYAFGDFNTDGRRDLVVGNPHDPKVLLFQQNQADMFDEPLSSPSLSGISDIVAGDFKGQPRDQLLHHQYTRSHSGTHATHARRPSCIPRTP